MFLYKRVKHCITYVIRKVQLKWVNIDLKVSCLMKNVFKERKLQQKLMSDDSKERVYRKFNKTSARIKEVVRSWI